VLIEPLLKQKEKQRRLEKKLASFDKVCSTSFYSVSNLYQDQMSLKNAKARLQVLKEKFKETIKEKEDVEGKYKRVSYEKLFIMPFSLIKKKVICMKNLKKL
jgi:hypothetical protein